MTAQNTSFEAEFRSLLLSARSGYLIPLNQSISWPPQFHELDVYSSCGDGLLHVASRISPLEIVRLLILTGMDVNKKGDYGYTPLHYACEAGRRDVYSELIILGGDPSVQNSFGDCPHELL